MPLAHIETRAEAMNKGEWKDLALDFEQSVCDVVRVDRRDVIGSLLSKHGYALGKGTVLDAGCGVGTFVCKHSWRFSEVLALDFVQEIAEQAKLRCSHIPNVKFDCLNILNLPPALRGNFDLVVSLNVLTTPSASWRARYWKATLSAVRKKGHLLLLVPSLESANFVQRYLGNFDLVNENAGLVNRDGAIQKFYSWPELEITLANLGLNSLELIKFHYPWSLEGVSTPLNARTKRPWDWLCFCERR
ncbi:class I SAM-dependent methyltransferase [Roseateles chitinivorans]|uniref:class I SAM-dependent methyltransferase n=1 Tax=Roseateles chitinivorans TaxID=2917965 RepID=UPI003D66927A